MSNADAYTIMFFRTLSSHPTLLRCPICTQIGDTHEEFMSHFQSHSMNQQAIFLLRSFNMLGITSSKGLPLDQQTRSAIAMPQAQLPPPHDCCSTTGNVRGKRLRENSIDIDLNKIPSESTSP